MTVTHIPEIQTQQIAANGLSFEVYTCEAEGCDGSRLALCLHGFPEHAYSWRYQLPLLAQLGYKAWAPCLRGYGNSSRPEGVNSYQLDCFLADVAGLIEASGAASTVLIGHDWGGAIAWMFAIRQVRPLERLIIMNLPHPLLFRRGLLKLPQMLRSWYVLFFQLPGLPEWLLLQNNAEAIAQSFYKMAIDKSRFPEEVLEVYRQNALQPGVLTAMLNYYRANAVSLLRDDPSLDWDEAIAHPLETPTLMIWGEEDSALGKELTVGTEALVKDFTLHYLPGVSHWVQQEAPERVNALMEAWLAGG